MALKAAPPRQTAKSLAGANSRPFTPSSPALWIIFGLLLLACYWRTIWQTGALLIDSEDMSHGLFAPAVAAYIVWERRASWLPAISRPSSWGIPLLIAAALLGLIATLGASTTLSRLAFLLSLMGMIVLLGGQELLRRFSFPLFLLLFTFPLPTVLYGEITLPLQLTASWLSEHTFEMLGFSVVRDGNILELAHQRLSVVEACSGIRSLVTLTFFCGIYAYFVEPRIWMRGLLILAAVPAAILLNVVRIVTTGILGKVAPALTEGIYHDILGWLCLSLGFLVVFLLHHVLPSEAHSV